MTKVLPPDQHLRKEKGLSRKPGENAERSLSRLLERLPLTERVNISHEQQRILKKALTALEPPHYKFDIRISIPVFFTPGFYLVILGDSECINARLSRIQMNWSAPQITGRIILEKCLLTLTQDERKLFSTEQLLILERAFQSFVPKKHIFYFRCAVSIVSESRFYLVVLLGKEQRQRSRILRERRTFWISFATIFIMSGLIIGAVFGSQFLASKLNIFEKPQANPTALPWIKTREDCTKQNRVWDNGKCWDRDHDPTF